MPCHVLSLPPLSKLVLSLALFFCLLSGLLLLLELELGLGLGLQLHSLLALYLSPSRFLLLYFGFVLHLKLVSDASLSFGLDLDLLKLKLVSLVLFVSLFLRCHSDRFFLLVLFRGLSEGLAFRLLDLLPVKPLFLSLQMSILLLYLFKALRSLGCLLLDYLGRFDEFTDARMHLFLQLGHSISDHVLVLAVFFCLSFLGCEFFLGPPRCPFLLFLVFFRMSLFEDFLIDAFGFLKLLVYLLFYLFVSGLLVYSFTSLIVCLLLRHALERASLLLRHRFAKVVHECLVLLGDACLAHFGRQRILVF